MGKTCETQDFCFVHAADLHLDTPFKGISSTAPRVGEVLREASCRAFDSLVDLCLAREAAFLLLAGDLYDGPSRGLRAQLRFSAGLSRLSDAGISTFAVHGNHDPVDQGWAAVSSWPAGVHFFSPEHVEAIDVVRDGQIIATVQGISYPTQHVKENLALGFSRRDGGGLQVGLLHCNVAEAASTHADYCPCSLSDLHAAGLDYFALGHVHSRQVLSGRPFGAEPYVVYPGNLQGRSPKPSELGAKGATVVEVRDGQVASVEAVACDVVRFVALEVDADSSTTVGDVRDMLAERGRCELEQADARSLVTSVRLTGRSAAHDELARPGVLAELLAALRESSDDDEPFLWWNRIEDETFPTSKVTALGAEGDFASDLLRLANELIAEADDALAGEISELVERMPLRLRRRALELVEDDLEPARLIEVACSAALNALEAPS